MFGKLAKKILGLKLDVKVLKSAAGFYIGTEDDKKLPVSRESNEYYQSFDQAQEALKNNSWTQKLEP